MKKILMLFFVLFFFSPILYAQTTDTLRIMAYNLLNFPQNNNPNRIPYYRTVFHSSKPDVIVLGEVTSNAGLNMLRDQALNVWGWTDWTYAPFVDGPDTDMALFYRTSKVQWLRNITLTTELRNIQVYHMKIAGRDSASTNFYIYAMHLKASNTPEDAAQRGREAAVARNHANSLPSNSRFFYCGDLNLYTSAENAYIVLTGSSSNNNGRSVDLLPAGNWSSNSNYRYIHTQSTRVRSFGGGTTGGLDDRFDFILPSPNFAQTTGSRYVPNSFRAYGNDGNHFNDSINSRPNNAVPDSVADALHYASDHLPVFADFIFVGNTTDISEPIPLLPSTFQITTYPNPFNSVLTMKVQLSGPPTNLYWQIFTSNGSLLYQSKDLYFPSGTHILQWTMPPDCSSGVYWIQWLTKNPTENSSYSFPVYYIK
ncbi:MAG: endonuclease/exonuclease/phosphatase family protein [bacterium]|nr:endonuclease/exonuclease/phosphatase family protein [bacterium]